MKIPLYILIDIGIEILMVLFLYFLPIEHLPTLPYFW